MVAAGVGAGVGFAAWAGAGAGAGFVTLAVLAELALERAVDFAVVLEQQPVINRAANDAANSDRVFR